MPGSLPRSAVLLVAPVAVLTAVAGALVLGRPGLLAVLVVAAVVGATTAGLVADRPAGPHRGTGIDAGVRAGVWTAGVLLVLAGIAAVAGGLVAFLGGGLVVAAVLALRVRRERRAATPSAASPVGARPDRMALLLPAPGGLSTPALGEEWARTTVLLDAPLDPVLRRAVVARREVVLDELERRDPPGFARWLAEGSLPGSDPARFVRDHPAAGSGAA